MNDEEGFGALVSSPSFQAWCSWRLGGSKLPPHAWLKDGRSLYDLFGFEWTLLCLNEASALGAPDLKIVHLADNTERNALREIYSADYALIRPDQIVAWRGSDAQSALSALERLRG